MKIKHIVFTLLGLGLCAFIIYRIMENAEDNSESKGGGKSRMPATVTGMILTPRPFADNLSLSGSIEANEQIEIRSEVPGIVESINFDEGSQVSKGQVLFKVNDLELRAQLSQALTAQELASENARRAKLLLEKEAISREEFDIATADFRSAQSQTQLIRAQLAKTTVRAPFAGKVGLRSISKGTYVTPANIVAKLVNTSQVKITFSIPEKYASQMTNGKTVNFTTSGYRDTFSARIYAVEPEVDVATRTLRLRAIAQNPEGKLIPGTFANVELPLDRIENALMVPTEALIPIQNGKKIFVARDGNAKEVVVETGARTEREVLITSGLKPGDTVLTTGVMSLRDGAPVNIKLVQPQAQKL